MGGLTNGLADAVIAGLLGAMVFFPAVVAPTVFNVLEEAPASRFLRALFPRYYAFIIVLSAAAFVLVLPMRVEALALGFVCISTIFVRQSLVPKINAWRDAAQGGNQRAERLFAIGHRFTVALNLVQMAVLIGVLAIRS